MDDSGGKHPYFWKHPYVPTVMTLQILQPGFFKTRGWNNQATGPELTLPQVVAKLKQATLEMLGEGAEAAQKMTRMINPEAGASWKGMIFFRPS